MSIAHADPVQLDLDAAPLLSPAEEHALAVRVREGDPEARERLILSNLKLVAFVARRFRRRGLPMDDLVSHGIAGLIVAVDRFDPARVGRDGAPLKFSNFAGWWVRQSIGRAIDNTAATIRRPISAIQAERSAFKEGRPAVGVPARVAVHLESSGDPDRPSPVALAPDHRESSPVAGAAQAEVAGMVERLLGQVHPREREVLCRRFGLGGEGPRTLAEIGAALGIHKERVRQIEAAALARLRAHVGRESRPSHPANREAR